MNVTGLGRWLKENEGLGWAGLVIGILGLLASPVFGLTSAVGTTIAFVGGAVIAIIAIAFFTRPSEFTLVCLSCTTTYFVSGVRGESTSRREMCLFQANAPMDTFVYAMKRRTGATVSETLKYRNLREGEGWYLLPKERIFPVSAPGGYMSYTIQPPTPIKKGDKIEVWDELALNKTFEGDHESVGKTLLYPTKLLKIRLEFDGCSVENCMGTRFAVTPLDGQPLESEVEGKRTVLSWTRVKCKSQESYRVSWTWQ